MNRGNDKLSIFDVMKTILLLFLLAIFNTAVPAQDVKLNKDSLEKYFNSSSVKMDPIEGIWNVSTTQESYRYDTLLSVTVPAIESVVAIVRKEDRFQSYCISGEQPTAQFFATDVAGVYMYQNYFPSFDLYTKKQALICKANEIEYVFDLPADYIKKTQGANFKTGTRIVNILKWTRVRPESKN